MNRLRHTLFLIVGAVIVCLPLFFSTASRAAPETGILVMPFDIHTSGELSFLQKGIQDMLNTRLSAGEGVRVVADEEVRHALDSLTDSITEQSAVRLAGRAKADYVLIGDITLDGDIARTEARLLAVGSGEAVIRFSRQGNSQGSILTHMNVLAAEIIHTVSGKPLSETVSPGPQTAAALPETPETHQHPEKLWKGLEQISSEPMKTLAGDGKTPVTIWKSPRFSGEIPSISHGDINGDGTPEVILILDNVVAIFRQQDGQLVPVAETRREPDTYLFRVDAGDINGNGRAEIFVNRLIRERTRVKSVVLEWDGSDLRQIAEMDSYLRVVFPSGEPVLLSQDSGRSGLFEPGIHRMNWKNGGYEIAGMFPAPAGANLFSFTTGPATNDGRDSIVQISSGNFLELSDVSGELEWTSPERFIGGSAYLTYPTDALDSRPADVPRKKRYYLPPRIRIEDIDRDGKNEVLVISNRDMTTHLLPNLRIFRSGHVQCLIWDGMGFSSKWKTSDVPGHISDILATDLNGDGKPEMVFSVIASVSSAFSRGESYLVFWAPN